MSDENMPKQEYSGIDRRKNRGGDAPDGRERRQFRDSHDGDPEVRELAEAIDNYKMANRRRFITYEEILNVVKSLGHHK